MQIREVTTPTEVDGRHRPRPLSPELDQGQVNGIFQVQKVQHPAAMIVELVIACQSASGNFPSRSISNNVGGDV